MDEKEITIISIIENEFDNLSINNLINELKKIPQFDFKNTRTFILKLFRDIDTATNNSKNRIKKYFQSLKSQNEQIIKKIYFQSRNKPLISKYNTKDSNKIKENSYQKQTMNDSTNYDNIQSIKNLKSSDENSIKEDENLFTKNIIEMKYLSRSNGMKGNAIKYKKKINLGNKSLSEFKIKTKQKINLNDSNKIINKEYNLYKLYNKAYNKNINNTSNNKSNSKNKNKNKIELNLNKENNYFSNLKTLNNLNIKKKIPSYDKKNIKKNNTKLINSNFKEKKGNEIYTNNFGEKQKNLFYFNNNGNDNNNDIINDNSIIKDIKIKNYINEKNNNNNETKCPFKNNENINNDIVKKVINGNNNNEELIYQNLANEIISFIDNMKDLQKNIINKNPNIKEMKYNFEKQKYLLYQKALKLSKINNNNNDNNINNKIILNLNNNLNNDNLRTSSILMDKSTNNTINNNDISNLENTKELNMSIINLRKTIEDIKNISQFTEQLKSEITMLNNKLKEKNEKEKEYENNIMENLTSIKKVYNILLPHCIKQSVLLTSIENPCPSPRNLSEKKFIWYINEITKFIDILINQNINKENDIKNNIILNENKKEKEDNINIFADFKDGLLTNILEIMNWITPFISKEKENNNILKQFEIQFEQNKFKEAFDLFKSKLKEVINLIENLNKHIKEIEKEKKDKINKDNKNKINLSFNEDDEEHLNDKNNFLQLNSTLLGIQNDLILKIENKEKEIEKIKKDLKNSIQLNKEFMNLAKNQKGQDVNIFAEKYKYLLDLFNSEQDKVKFLQNEYMSLLNGLSNYVNNGEEIIVKLGKMWNIKPVINSNFEVAEPDFPEIEPINESDLLTEKS